MNIIPQCDICGQLMPDGECAGFLGHDRVIGPPELSGKARWIRERSFGPMCRCGARNTARIGDSALQRQCQNCGRTFFYRVCNGHVVAFAPDTAASFDQERAVSRWSIERMTEFLKRASIALEECVS